MAGLNLFIQAGTVPFGTQLPASAQALINLVAAYTGIGGANGFNGINFGSQTPAPQNRSLPWFKTDSFGNPIGFFSWNGTAWVTTPSTVASGPTSGRPAGPANGTQYYDTTLGAVLIFNTANNAWTTASGVPGDIKEVTTTTLAQALINNPGWAQHTASSGCVIAGSDVNSNGPASAHSQGSLIGEETHALAVSELAAHTHTSPFAAFTGAFQNGPQASGVYTAITPGTTGIPVSITGTTGGGSGHNNIQPSLYLFRLYKLF